MILMSSAGLPAATSRVRMSLAKASASSKCVQWPEKMTSALAAAKSRPVEESPAWKMTGCPWGLRGNVASYLEKVRGERASLAVPGVKAVANDLLVHLKSAYRRTDTEVAQAAVA